jgi:hypothetical protein
LGVAELTWHDAIVRVLKSASPEAMHYTDIAEAILSGGLKAQAGATPARTVNATIAVSMKGDTETPFKRVGPGLYALVDAGSDTPPALGPAAEDDTKEDTGLVNALGMYWARSAVRWTSAPCLWGRYDKHSTQVDFGPQQGVYLLHDRREVVYVGRTTDQPLGVRLRRHVDDRLGGRWDRFSWFGVFPVTEAGKLDTKAAGSFDLATLIVTMEALLIEGLEPRQNRKRGDGFKAVEYLQVEDPQIEKERMQRLLDRLRLGQASP